MHKWYVVENKWNKRERKCITINSQCFLYEPLLVLVYTPISVLNVMKESSPAAIHLEDYKVPPFLIDRTDLRFELRDDVTIVSGKLQCRRNPDSEENTNVLRLDGESLELISVAVNGEPLSEAAYTLNETSLTLHAPADVFVVDTKVAIHPERNTALEGLYRSSGNFCTQCEAQGFRKITYYLDRPDVMAVFSTTIIADEKNYPVLLSNGNLVQKQQRQDGRHLAKWEDPFPKPSYLFALVAGDLAVREDHFRTRSGREVTLQIFTEQHNLDRTAHAMASLKKAMRWDEEAYGREYDLDIYMIVSVDDFNMGAMENKGLNIFNSKLVLARPDTATDTDYVNIEAVIAHEYFHNWTGNRITCRDWFQLSLKEGLTVFRDQSFTADMTSEPVKRIDDVRALRSHQFLEDESPMAHPVRPSSYIEINNFYTLTVYEKGAEVVRMYQTLLGREGFRRGMDLYFERHDGQAVTTDDFRRAMEDANGVDLSQFQRWYEQAGTPEVTVKSAWDEVQGKLTLTIEQYCPPTPESSDKKPFLIPLKIGLVDSTGADMELHCENGKPTADPGVFQITQQQETLVFSHLKEKPVPSLFRHFSAPIKLKYDYSDEELAFLLAHDNDNFNRWDAGQQLYIRCLLSMVADLRRGTEATISPVLLKAVGHLLEERHNSDPALLAEALALPDEAYVGDQLETIDVDLIHDARTRLRKQLADTFTAQWEAIYTSFQTDGEYRIDATSMGRRRLKNLALDFLIAGDEDKYAEIAMQQYVSANNMTDSIAVLQVLKDSDSAVRKNILASFHERWKNDPLVLDKWFAIQATSARSDTLDVVKRLMSHPGFSMTNPNRVRALIGAFMQANPVGFHRRDGAGYHFSADMIMALDEVNPQIAARLAKVLSRWRRYDDQRQAAMRQALQRIAAKEPLSADVFEVVSNSLSS